MDLDKDQDIHEHLGAGRYRDAFELLLARYQHKVFRLSWSMLGDQTAAEEMMERGFMPLASLKDQPAVRLVRLQSIADPVSGLAGRWES